MKSQWDCLLQNLGEWHGSFTRLNPRGDVVQDTPTIVSLLGLNDNQTIRQTVQRFETANNPTSEKVFEYSSLGRGVLFFENGAFSQGSIQLAPFAEFGAELGLIEGDRRLRLVQLFDRNGNLEQFTLIRERREGVNLPELPPLTLEDLLGDWQGEATTLYPDWRSPEVYPTRLKVERQGDRLIQHLTFGQDGNEIASSAAIEGSRLLFDQGNSPVQVLLLPAGASATCPLSVKVGQSVFLEVGWLLQPSLRQRLIRSYNPRGEWISLTLVTERKD